jgi:tRNA threonylcarbamoyladenosine biosynthesis protein TsaB
MIVLGIETATSVCGVALLRDGRLAAERSVNERYAHAERLFGFLDDVMEEGGVGLRDLHGIAVSIGPGSFTGLRIGLSVVKGLHMAAGIPVVAVPTLTALAGSSVREAKAGGADTVIAVLDARRNEVYMQVFQIQPGGVEPVTTVQDVLLDRLLGKIPRAGRMALTGEARESTAEALIRAGVERGRLVVISEPAARCSAVSVAKCGALLLAAGSVSDVAALEPQYIKEFFLRTPES